MNRKSPISSQHGVGMLEVLIALLVLAVGVLGFAGLQMTALSKSNEANQRAGAVLIAQDAVERLELNPSKRDTYLKANWVAGTLGATPGDKCIAGSCSTAEMADWDIAQLTWQAANLLPGGRIMVADCAFNNLTCITVSWDGLDPDKCIGNDGLNTDEERCFVLEVAR